MRGEEQTAQLVPLRRMPLGDEGQVSHSDL